MDNSTNRQKLVLIARSFRTAMVTTRGLDGTPHTRPMSVARIDDNGDMWFATGINSTKFSEIEANSQTSIVMQSGLCFAAFSGTAEGVVDRYLARKLWKEAWRPWFPGGPTDPELKLMCVHLDHGEYWDLTGLRGVRYVVDAVRHALAGKRMSEEADDERHGIADFAHV